MGQPFEITYFDRYSDTKLTEKVYGDSMVKFAYNSFAGKALAPIIGSRALSKAYGAIQDMSFTSKKVPNFIKNFDIPINEYEKGSLSTHPIETSYKNFNEFFIRRLKPGVRDFNLSDNQMAAFAEARYFGHEAITDELTIPVKGNMLKAIDLIGDKEIAKDFEGGPLMIARLCPVDYHRYHYPDSGTTIKSFTIHGDYHSVNPLALKYRHNIFIKNERRVSILDTQHFGMLAYIEVGATCVGKIVQSFDESKAFKKGDEKGHFLFGGSTVIVCGEPGKWKPSLDMLENTKLGIETYIKLQDEVATLMN